MIQATVIEGSPEEVLREAEALIRGRRADRLTLVLLSDETRSAEDASLSARPLWRHGSTEEMRRALDAIEFKGRPLPVLPPEAFDRENLYEERW